jgi:hypothetical protein
VSQALIHWLVELGKDPSLASRFEADPEREMEAAGLTARDKEAVRSKDLARLHSRLVEREKENSRPIVVSVGF